MVLVDMMHFAASLPPLNSNLDTGLNRPLRPQEVFPDIFSPRLGLFRALASNHCPLSPFLSLLLDAQLYPS